MEKYILYSVNEDQSKCPIEEFQSCEDAVSSMVESNGIIYSLEKTDGTYTTVLF